MNKALKFEEKVAILREYEVYCYQIAFALLKKEDDAIQAASQTLLDLSQDEAFFLASPPHQRSKVKSSTIKRSIMLKQSGCQKKQEC